MRNRSAYTEVDLGALRHNIREARRHTAEGTPFLAVVKADAYGHGSVPVSRICLEEGASMLGVAIPEEGVALREAGVTAPILVLSGVDDEGALLSARYGLTQTVYDPSGVERLNAICEAEGLKCAVHVKIDGGMGRIGARTKEELEAILSAHAKAPRLEITGVFTHFADADGPDPAFTRRQIERFDSLRRLLPAGITAHAAASAAALRYPEAAFDMVRYGIVMYGCAPYPNCPLDLRPVLSWKTEAVYVKRFQKGDSFSYGRTFIADRDGAATTLSIGYGDGYPRILSNRADVLIHGKRCRILGRVCMDAMMVDVTDVDGVTEGTEAVLIGRSGAECVTADELAALSDTISYEILLSPGPRNGRVYIGQ
ncbi:MAG: alanine racemase [Clostridia bacterium]|nr:alanine racemase [Clostridia bacterium]